MLKELWSDMPVWMRVLIGVQIVAYIGVVIGLVLFVHHLKQLDWSHGLEGVWILIWKGQP